MPSSLTKKKKKKVDKNKELKYLLYVAGIILIILLTIYNLQMISNKQHRVLGMSDEINFQQLDKEKEFWNEFLSINPTYYDGWKRLSIVEYLLQDNTSAQKASDVANRIDANH